jgi:putative membrane protein (TIGR04086 family)
LYFIHRWLSRRIRSSLLSGLVVSFSVLLLSGVFVAALMDAVDLPTFIFSFLVYCCHVGAIFAGSVHTTFRRKKRSIFHGIRISVAYALIVWLISLLVFNHDMNWNTLTLFLLALMIGGASAMWASQKRDRRRK